MTLQREILYAIICNRKFLEGTDKEMNDVRDMLQIKIESPYWDEAYKLALSEADVPEWMTEEYIRVLHREKGVLPKAPASVENTIGYD